MSEQNITRRSRGDPRTGKTDWARVEQQTDAEIERAVVSDPDAAPLLDDAWFEQAEVVVPSKEMISIRLDSDVLDYFRSSGNRYQTRINAILRAYMDAQRRKTG
ncbi:MAG: BrnA antitoxin family protein [Alphaproteobacteria bacterium]|nr:BrnA antitoxin family protein [Alphaproteobacteria bacterium]